MRHPHRYALMSTLIIGIALTAGSAGALSEGAFHCALGGGNGIVVDFELKASGGNAQGDFFQLTGQWDDASLTPLLPIFGSVLTDSNFGVVGGFSRVGFRVNTPLPGSPFASWPAGIHVQFRLTEPPIGGVALPFTGRWADNRGNRGSMSCTFAP